MSSPSFPFVISSCLVCASVPLGEINVRGVSLLHSLMVLGQHAPLKRLDDATRVKALAALAALIILGFAMVLLTWLAARVVQRYRQGTSYFRPTPRPGEHAWAKKPLNPPDLR